MPDSLEISKLIDDFVNALEDGDEKEIQQRLANLRRVIYSADNNQILWQQQPLLEHQKIQKALSEKRYDIINALLDSLKVPGNAELIEGIRALTSREDERDA